MIQKLNAEGKLEKKEAKKGGSYFDKVRIFVKSSYMLACFHRYDVFVDSRKTTTTKVFSFPFLQSYCIECVILK